MTRIEEADEYRKEQYYTSNSQAFWDGFECADNHPLTPWRQDYLEEDLPKHEAFLVASEDGQIRKCSFDSTDKEGKNWCIFYMFGVNVTFEYLSQKYPYWMPIELPNKSNTKTNNEIKMNKEGIYKIAINRLGVQSQLEQMDEEFHELGLALHHYKRGKNKPFDVITELADVTIMLRQMSLIFGQGPIDAEIESKTRRLLDRLFESGKVTKDEYNKLMKGECRCDDEDREE